MNPDVNADSGGSDAASDDADVASSPAAPGGDDPASPPEGTEGLGRQILLTVGAGIIAVSGVVGWVIGSNGAAAVPQSAILGTALTIPTTPVAMTLYGMGVSTLLLVVLFGLVAFAARTEQSSTDG